jgi:hypothetical protein
MACERASVAGATVHAAATRAGGGDPSANSRLPAWREAPVQTRAWDPGLLNDLSDRVALFAEMHLREHRQQHYRELRHRILRLGGVDLDRVGEAS